MKTVRIWSYLRSLVSRPIADVMPGYGGTITSGMPSDVGDLGRVHRARAAEGDERELARVAALLTVRERIAPDMFAFAIVTIPSAASSRPSPSRSASRCDRRRGELAVELHLAAEEAVGVDPAEDDVRVGQRRLLAALAVAAGPGRRARAARPDAEGAAFVDVGDRAAAGADRVDVDHRHEQRVAGDPGVARRGLADAALGDDADVGGRAAHVEGDQALAAGQSRPPRAPPSTPAAGPERSSVTGFARRRLRATRPRRSTSSRAAFRGTPSLASAPRAARGSGPVDGPTKAFMHAVVKRSNSRNCGKMSALDVTNAPGISSATISAARRSCSGLR